MSRLIDAEALERDGWRMSRIVQIDEKTMEAQTRKPTDFPAVEPQPEPCEDTISRQSAIQAAECIVDHHAITPYQTMRSAMDHLQRILRGMPSAQPERIRGRWVKDEEASNQHVEPIYICSACNNMDAWGEVEKNTFKFCPNCGADMRNKEDGE